MSLSYEASVIFVRDLAASRDFYERVLGMTVMMDNGPNVVYVGGLSIWEACRAASIALGEAAPAGPMGRGNMELYFESEDVEGEFARLASEGAEVVHPPRDESWGQKTSRLRDPDGHLIEIGEPMPAAIRRLFAAGSTPEKISERTGMPMELVLQAIGHPRFC